MRGAHGEQGFTLIELLLAAAIGIVLISLIVNFMLSTRQVTVGVMNRASGLETLQAASSAIADDVRRATKIEGSLSIPSWAGASGATQALILVVGPDATCATAQDVTFYFFPRSSLTGTATPEWIRLPDDSLNSARSVLLRASQCGTTVRTRLVADYLDAPEFQLAQIGSSTFTTTPTSATGGFPYLSVRTSLAIAVTTREGTTRVPATGASVSIATSRTIDPP